MRKLSKITDSSRRDFLRYAGLTAFGLSVGAVNVAEVVEGREVERPLTHLSASRLAELIAARQVSSEEVAEAYLKRIEEVNPKLNAIVQMDAERVRIEARQADKDLAKGIVRGPLHGVPFTMKDSILTKGMITTNGCPELRHYVPKEDATVVRRLKEAGGILLGKTNVPELCYLGTTDNLVYGRTNNPYDLSRTPGGSSGGEGAIIAASGSPFGIGTDIGGSIRIPAHFCGIAGIKPTSRLVPETGIPDAFPVPFHDWNGIGPMARYVEDLELVLSVIAGPDGFDLHVPHVTLDKATEVPVEKLKIAFCPDDGGSTPSAETREAVQSAADALRDTGATVVDQGAIGMEQAQDIWMYNLLPFWENAGKYYRREFAKLAGSTVSEERHFGIESLMDWLDRLGQEQGYNSESQTAWFGKLQQFRGKLTEFMVSNEFDAILSPASNNPAGAHRKPNTPSEVSASEGMKGFKAHVGGYHMTHNLTGWPAAVVRAGTSSEGMPIGVQIAAKPWQEDVVLAVAKVIEEKCGGWQAPPL